MSGNVRKVYIDYNATTPLHEEVKKSMAEDFNVFGNASSMHESGRRARARIEQARGAVAKLIGAGDGAVIFTSGGSESNNTVFNAMRLLAAEGGRDEFIISSIEHPCVMNAALSMQKAGFKLAILPVDEYGKLKMEELEKALGNKTLLVSIMAANNEIGTLQDVKRIAALVKKAGAFMHTDAVQAVGKIPVNAQDWGVDYLTLSAHKIYGPKGAGALYVKKDAPLSPLIHGGHQEDGLRAGTYNNGGILGFGKAAEIASSG
ncbi:MAG: cysteine desulfurase, partial [Treponema sp.]|nr:cysteine desulfurase [Treponema sp.]